MIYVSSDWHGYSPEKIKALLARASFGDGDFLYVLGDVIDRGDFGIELIKWLMSEPNMRLILGNHEGLLISNAWVFSRITDDSLDELDNAKIRAMGMWMRDGGDPTMKALAKESEEVRADILEYLKCECPLYEQINVGGREILLCY